jgi:hypothetical protein
MGQGLLGPILLVSLVLRVSLVLSGGQDYWPDEDTTNPRAILTALINHDFNEAFVRLDSASHPLLFKVMALVPAAIELATGDNAKIYALFIAMCSVLNIWLIAQIARRLGASDVESLLAAGFLALSSTFFYWARHVQAYDLAMTFALLALYAGLGAGRSHRRVYLCGVLGGCSFLAYSGYWTTVAAVTLTCVIQHSKKWPEVLGYGALSALGVATVMSLVVGTSAALQGHFLSSLISYSGTVDQGTFEEGWSLPIEYLWHAEHLLLVVWMVCVASWLWRPQAIVTSPQLRAGFIGLVVIYAAMATGSVLFHKFVVYGRLARQLVPFFCLVAAHTFQRLGMSQHQSVRRLATLVIVAMIVQAAVNFREPLLQSFPADFIARNQPDDAVTARYQRMIWVNAKHLYPGPPSIELPSRYVTLAEARHPLQFLPYQYEGYTPRQRQTLRSADIRMRLLGVLP